MTQQYAKLKALLQELFQLDQPDLDFGLYRVMHAKSAEVSTFLDKDLLPQVRAAFAQFQSADKAELEKELAKAIEQAQALGADPDTLPKVKELRAKLASEAVDVRTLERDVYDHLYAFFRRYYSEGDYLAKRVYKPGVYAIPYEGEEVTLHWANKDQYYIKTSEYLRDYAFRLRPDDEANPMRVHFRLVDAAEGEHGNVKTAENKERRFKLAAEQPLVVENDELMVRFTYLSDDKKQAELNAEAEAAVLATTDAAFAEWVAALKALAPTEKDAKRTVLAKHLKGYSDRNTFDYFIHKDLGGFLRRELDFYIKNEVMHLDDVENETPPRVEQYLSKIKVVRRIAGKIIDFLAQLEEFQKKLWLKKKFVVETSWCIRLGVTPEAFYAEIAANEGQREEWVRLCAIDELKPTAGSLLESGKPGYSKPLTPTFLTAHPTLMVDTRHFDADFTARLLDAMGNVDVQVDGVLFRSENFQAVTAMSAKMHGRVNYIYLDPPFNTTDVGFAYKNEYRHSSWLAMVLQSLLRADASLSPNGVVSLAIDDAEVFNLGSALDDLLTAERRVGVLVVEIKPSGRTNDRFLSTSHEYYLWYAKSDELADISFFDLSTTAAEAYSEEDTEGEYKWRDFLRTGGFSTPAERPNSFYAIYFREADGYIGTVSMPGAIEILPLDSSGERRVWRKTPPSFLTHVAAGDIKVELGRGGDWKVRIKDRIKSGTRPKSVWTGAKYDAASHGTKLLQSILGDKVGFAYPKSLNAVFDAIWVAVKEQEEATVLDYFAGSGTTGHAVINLNREDGGRRKFILVEMGEYFDTVLLPRIKKIAFSPEWKDGKPKRLATSEEDERSPRIVKVVRLESYEDALNNLETRRSDKQQLLLDAPEAQGADRLKEQYLLGYMLDVETRGSQSLLNVRAFTDPTAYKLKVKRPGSDESREVNVDLLETFNWLLGLTVRHIAAPQTFSASFVRDSEGRLRLKDERIKQDAAGPYWYRTVTGTTPDGRTALVIWRKLTGHQEQDNLVLDEWFTKQGYSAKDSEFDLIHVNGGNNLENLKTPDDRWKVRLIEEDFHRLMFEGTEGAQ